MSGEDMWAFDVGEARLALRARDVERFEAPRADDLDLAEWLGVSAGPTGGRTVVVGAQRWRVGGAVSRRRASAEALVAWPGWVGAPAVSGVWVDGEVARVVLDPRGLEGGA